MEFLSKFCPAQKRTICVCDYNDLKTKYFHLKFPHFQFQLCKNDSKSHCWITNMSGAVIPLPNQFANGLCLLSCKYKLKKFRMVIDSLSSLEDKLDMHIKLFWNTTFTVSAKEWIWFLQEWESKEPWSWEEIFNYIRPYENIDKTRFMIVSD